MSALVGAAIAVVLIFVPPLWSGARHYVYEETIQFCLAAFALPALVVVGGRWQWLERTGPGDGRRQRRGRVAGRLWRALERLGQSRLRHPELVRSLGFLGVDVALLVLWRTPAWVDTVARHEWLVVAEALSLLVAGIGLWLELIACPPLSPRLARPWRAVVAALAMWASWIMAYVVGFSHTSWYRAYHHVAGGLGASADQQIAAGIVWIAAVCTFVPVIFFDVISWLKNTDDPDAELRQLVRAERRSGWRHPWEPPNR